MPNVTVECLTVISRAIKHLNLSKFKALLRIDRPRENQIEARVKNIFTRRDEIIYRSTLAQK